MGLQDSIAEVIGLQGQYTSKNTDVMRRRGLLIRHEIPKAATAVVPYLAQRMRVSPQDLVLEGRDGVGLKSEVPWVRFASKTSSPKATAGWYVVLLFKRDGSGVYLSLAHGSTQFVNGALIARSDDELERLMTWSRRLLANDVAQDSRLVDTVSLASIAPLALAYEKSCVASYFYPLTDLPPDEALFADMLTMADFLGRLYDAEQQGQSPLSASPEVRDALEAATGIASPAKQGQGFALTSMERRAVERRAMEVAASYLRACGYSVLDVCLTESFDLVASRSDETLKVEVKGTTGSPTSILLTRNEVELHKGSFPNNALIVVHSIFLDKGASPIASGGELVAWQPWSIDESHLRPITYLYEL